MFPQKKHIFAKTHFLVKTIFRQNRKNTFSAKTTKPQISCSQQNHKIIFLVKIAKKKFRQNCEYLYSAKTTKFYFLPKPYFKIFIF